MAGKGVIQNRLSQPLGSKYLSATDHTEVNCTEFVTQEDTIITLLEGGDASVTATDVDYKSSMNLDGVTLKKGALIVSPAGEAFQNINISEGSALAYNSVFKGEKPGPFVGLLDLYPNASAAYSLRKLRANYEGDAIEVRRSVGTPVNQNIGFNSDGELDTAALLAFVGSGDGFVVTWYDQSGGGNDATQVEGNRQPKIVSSGVIELENGKPCAVFDGVNDYLESQNGFNEPIASFVSVYKNYQNDNNRPFGVRDSLGSSNKNTFSITSSNVLVFDGAFLAASIAATISQKITYAQKSTTNARSYINGVENNNSSISLNNTIGLFNIGNAHGALGLEFNGSFQMGIFYPTDQSANRVGIETNINDYYSVYE